MPNKETPPASSTASTKSVECTRCHCDKVYMGTKQFHEGKRWGILGDLGELFVNKESFDVFACPRCGSVEFSWMELASICARSEP